MYALELKLSELIKFTKNIAEIVQACANGALVDELLTLFKTLDDWFCASQVKETRTLSDSLRTFRSAVNISEKAKTEFDEYRDGRSIIRC